jgi:hypothetical protein
MKKTNNFRKLSITKKTVFNLMAAQASQENNNRVLNTMNQYCTSIVDFNR